MRKLSLVLVMVMAFVGVANAALVNDFSDISVLGLKTLWPCSAGHPQSGY